MHHLWRSVSTTSIQGSVKAQRREWICKIKLRHRRRDITKFRKKKSYNVLSNIPAMYKVCRKVLRDYTCWNNHRIVWGFPTLTSMKLMRIGKTTALSVMASKLQIRYYLASYFTATSLVHQAEPLWAFHVWKKYVDEKVDEEDECTCKPCFVVQRNIRTGYPAVVG